MQSSPTNQPTDTKALTRRCVIWSLATLFFFTGFLLSAERSVGVTLGACRASFSGATLVIGQAPPGTSRGVSAFAEDYWYSPQSTAWRPIHTRMAGQHSLVIPLWQPLLLSTAFAMYGWGKLRGARFADPQRCRGCGYSLIGLPESGGQRCPECGRPVS